MSQESAAIARRLKAERAAAEAERVRLAKEAADKAALEAEQARLAAEVEQARLAKEAAEKAPLEAEQARLAKIEANKAAAQAEQIRLEKLEQDSLAEVLNESNELNSQRSYEPYNVFVRAEPIQKLIAAPLTNLKSLQLTIIQRKADGVCLAADYVDTMNKFIVVYQENDQEYPTCSADFCISPLQQQIVIWRAVKEVYIAPSQPLPLIVWDMTANNSHQICEMRDAQPVSLFYPSLFLLSLLSNNSAQVYTTPVSVMPIWPAPLLFALDGEKTDFTITYYKNQTALVNVQYPVEFVSASDPQPNNITVVDERSLIVETKPEQKTPDNLKLKIGQAKAICDSKVADLKTGICEARAKEAIYFSCKEKFSNPNDLVDCIVNMHNSSLSSCNDLFKDLCGEVFAPLSEI